MYDKYFMISVMNVNEAREVRIEVSGPSVVSACSAENEALCVCIYVPVVATVGKYRNKIRIGSRKKSINFFVIILLMSHGDSKVNSCFRASSILRPN